MNSSAQHAVPNGIGQSEYFRPQLITESMVVVMTALSKFDSIPIASVPFERSAPETVIPAQEQHAEEDGHLGERQHGGPVLDEVLVGHGPGEEKHRLEVEQQEQHGDEEELHAEPLV